MFRLFFGLFLVSTLSACITSPYPVGGAFYSNLKGPNHAVIAKNQGEKSGRSCATTILGMAGWGDASIEAAKKAGGITEVSAVDYEFFNVVLGSYLRTCTIVSGS